MQTAIDTNTALDWQPLSDGGQASFEAQRTVAVTLNSSKHLDLNLVTAQGDKVTISLDAKAAALYGKDETLAVDNQGLNYRQTEISINHQEREMTFTVEGDLNQQELRDIRTILGTLDNMMNHLLDGQIKPMLAKARKLENLETIDGLEAHMSVARSTLVAQQTQISAVTEAAGIAGPPAVQPASSLQMQMQEMADASADEMARIISSTRLPMKHLRNVVDQLLSGHRKQMERIDTMGGQVVDQMAETLWQTLSQLETAPSANDPFA
ncbi:MAG: hypothetical protein HKP58_02950 [Desulfatitalea sp.]|nr:hypothetical protein [Desulfatitalea sp.]NNJ99349.1 hypothetical protein [Desulfatitalea sp.]